MLINDFFQRLFGNRNQRLLKKLTQNVHKINQLEDQIQSLSDEQLRDKTKEFKKKYQDGVDLKTLLPEVFAVMRETSRRVLGMRHFDVQLLGGMVLHSGRISEMKTGEGKTLIATLPAYLNAITGNPVHIVTVNDYLAQRDSKWMGKAYDFLDLSVGVITSGQSREEKKAAYQCDIVYGTNNEFGFDYLKDNMVFSAQDRCQRGLVFAIIDEVDSILIDEARTPLVISGPSTDSPELYIQMNKVVKNLKPHTEASEGDFEIDEKVKSISLTELGHENLEQQLISARLLEENGSLYDASNINLMHHALAALKAHNTFTKDVDYIVRDNSIVIIDEFTGRMMEGRRWSDGLHQAVEAKENVSIQKENQTLASITFQNYFRLYEKLSGMTGTADTESPEFLQIYGLEVVVLPTHHPMIRNDNSDLVFRTQKEKYDAICETIKQCQSEEQPILVGTASIESSEYLSSLLNKAKIKHAVLNAKHHEKEAEIIAEAGRPARVTIATNMAGRGTDIVLGGNLELELADAPESKKEQIQTEWKKRSEKVLQAGGLFVLGTERNESRRVDNQLRGRCGRQGDPGVSCFYLSLEDSLMRIFGSERIASLMEKMGMNDGEPIEHPWVTSAIENAQKKVEGHNFDARKQLLEYDDVANEQRKVIYKQRNELIEIDDISEHINHSRHEIITQTINAHIQEQSLEEEWNIPSLMHEIKNIFGIELDIAGWIKEDEKLNAEGIFKRVKAEILQYIENKSKRVEAKDLRHFEKSVMLQVLDQKWKEHLSNIDHLRQGVSLRSYAQKNPKQEYKRESFNLFTDMLDQVKLDVVMITSKFEVPSEEDLINLEKANRAKQAELLSRSTTTTYGPRTSAKVGRNEPCPCKSGKKYKHCHGKI